MLEFCAGMSWQNLSLRMLGWDGWFVRIADVGAQAQILFKNIVMIFY